MTTASSAALKPQTHEVKIKTGLDDAFRADMSASLSEILASTYRLTIKSHLYHWNVVGPLFKPLHELTEEHYLDLFAAVDVIAERIRALGHLAPVKMSQAARFAPAASDIAELTGESMVNDLVAEHEATVRAIREAADSAEEAGDIVTADMLTARSTFHEKAVWMLRAIVAK